MIQRNIGRSAESRRRSSSFSSVRPFSAPSTMGTDLITSALIEVQWTRI